MIRTLFISTFLIFNLAGCKSSSQVQPKAKQTGDYHVSNDPADTTFWANYAAQKRQLLFDLTKRKLTHEELMTVDININIQEDVPFYRVDKYAELYDALAAQWAIQKGRPMDGYRRLSTAKGQYNRTPQEDDDRRAVEDLILELQNMTAPKKDAPAYTFNNHLHSYPYAGLDDPNPWTFVCNALACPYPMPDKYWITINTDNGKYEECHGYDGDCRQIPGQSDPACKPTKTATWYENCVKPFQLDLEFHSSTPKRQLPPSPVPPTEKTDWPKIISAQIVLDAVQAKYPGNEYIKPCGPDNHDGACFDPTMPHVINHLYLDRLNCESDENARCYYFAAAGYWVPLDKPVFEDKTPVESRLK